MVARHVDEIENEQAKNQQKDRGVDQRPLAMLE